MIHPNLHSKIHRLLLTVLAALLIGVVVMSPAIAQDSTDVLVWSLGYSGDYNDILVERFNEANDDVNIVYEDVLTGTFTENNQKVRVAMENEAGPHVLRRRGHGRQLASTGGDRASQGPDRVLSVVRLD